MSVTETVFDDASHAGPSAKKDDSSAAPPLLPGMWIHPATGERYIGRPAPPHPPAELYYIPLKSLTVEQTPEAKQQQPDAWKTQHMPATRNGWRLRALFDLHFVRFGYVDPVKERNSPEQFDSEITVRPDIKATSLTDLKVNLTRWTHAEGSDIAIELHLPQLATQKETIPLIYTLHVDTLTSQGFDAYRFEKLKHRFRYSWNKPDNIPLTRALAVPPDGVSISRWGPLPADFDPMDPRTWVPKFPLAAKVGLKKKITASEGPRAEYGLRQPGKNGKGKEKEINLEEGASEYDDSRDAEYARWVQEEDSRRASTRRRPKTYVERDSDDSDDYVLERPEPPSAKRPKPNPKHNARRPSASTSRPTTQAGLTGARLDSQHHPSSASSTAAAPSLSPSQLSSILQRLASLEEANQTLLAENGDLRTRLSGAETRLTAAEKQLSDLVHVDDAARDEGELIKRQLDEMHTRLVSLEKGECRSVGEQLDELHREVLGEEEDILLDAEEELRLLGEGMEGIGVDGLEDNFIL